MPIQLIDKIKQKNDGKFYLVDAVDVEYNKKSLIDALKAGEIIPAGGGSNAGTFHVANVNIGSNTQFDSSKLTPSEVAVGDLIVDANGDFYTVTAVEGTTVTPSAALTADGGGTLGFKGAKGDKGDTGPAGPQGPKGDAFSVAKTYASIEEMNADYENADIPIGSFVVISTPDVDNADNAKMFVKNDTQYAFVTDLSGAQGIQGPAGPAGEKGAKGDPGEKGDTGPAGAKGDTGQRGNRITTGDGAPGEPPADSLVGDIYIDSGTGDMYAIQDQ